MNTEELERSYMTFSSGVHPKKYSSIKTKGKVIHYGLHLDDIYVGHLTESLYQVSIDESWTTLWHGLVPSASYIETSKDFCEKLGFRGRIVPFLSLVNLNLCLGLECFSESCLLYLGIRDVIYEKPVVPGDTLKSVIVIEKVKNISNGTGTIVYSRHVLLNQHDDRVFSFEQISMFPFLDGKENRYKAKESNNLFLYKLIEKEAKSYIRKQIFYKGKTLTKKDLPYQSVLEKGILYLHGLERPIGVSENLMFNSMYENTHPIHSNYARFKEEGIIISGGFVMALMLGITTRDFRQILDQEIIRCTHIEKVFPKDNIGAISYIHDVQHLSGGFEEVLIKTLGIKNKDVARDLSETAFPLELFTLENQKPSYFKQICEKECPEIKGDLCVEVVWKILRRKL